MHKAITASFRWRFGIIFSLASAILIAAHMGASAPDDKPSLEGTNAFPLATYRFKGEYYASVILRSKITEACWWQADRMSEPPLSPRQALTIAERKGYLMIPAALRFKPHEISLKRIAGSYMYYVIEIEPVYPGPSAQFGAPMEPIKVVVLMDGTVGEPVIMRTQPVP